MFTPKSICCGTIQFDGYLWTNQRALLNLSQFALHDDNTELSYEKVNICPFAIVRYVKKPVICANPLGFELYDHHNKRPVNSSCSLAITRFHLQQLPWDIYWLLSLLFHCKGHHRSHQWPDDSAPNISPSFAGQLRQLAQAPPESPLLHHRPPHSSPWAPRGLGSSSSNLKQTVSVRRSTAWPFLRGDRQGCDQREKDTWILGE